MLAAMPQPLELSSASAMVHDKGGPAQVAAMPSPTLLDLGLDEEALATATKILDVICRYRLRRRDEDNDRPELKGRLSFLLQVYHFVQRREPVRMCLPGFPFKSPNNVDKVLGELPDKGDEFALANLNGLCAAISDIYEAGARLTIISDGLVYNDLLGVPDKSVWAYGEALRNIALDKGFRHISFSRLQDLVHLDIPEKMDEIVYMANASNFRRALLNVFSRSNYDASREISGNEDTCLTYRGYIKFLETDLKHVFPIGDASAGGRSKSKFKAGAEYVAKQMLYRGDAFARAVRENYRDHLRLSIHHSVGENKIPISPLPTVGCFSTPWHCSMAISIDGTVSAAHRSQLEKDDKYELVYEDGRPSYFREKSDLFSWEGVADVVFEPIYPCGWIVRPVTGAAKGKKLSIRDIDSQKVRALSERASPVVMRGFSGTKNRDAFVSKGHEFGTPLPWKFGLVLEVKDRGEDARGLNNVLSAEPMPFHFDGLFKTHAVKQEDGSDKMMPNPPRFQFFTSVTPSPTDTGFTLFTCSHRVFEGLPSDLPLSRLSQLTWSVKTDAFDATAMTGIPLIQAHPSTGAPCLRYHEPWPRSRTAFDATEITIEGVDAVESERICAVLDSLLYDRRNCLHHVWEEGDLLVSDNILTMHTRSDFKSGSPRELWRIHFD